MPMPRDHMAVTRDVSDYPRIMDRATQLALNRINQRFYAAIADEWSDKRRWPWPGFERMLRFIRGVHTSDGQHRLRVLDLGCGDGRFAAFVADGVRAGTLSAGCSYLGLDASCALLERARARGLGDGFRFLRADCVEAALDGVLAQQRFDLSVMLGVLHHIPGFEQRARLVRTLADRLAPSGSLVLTVWRLDEDTRFTSRIVPFDAYNRTAEEPIELSQLEPGDTLIRWGDRGAPPRYCHFPGSDTDELQRLVAASGLQTVARFRADGHRGRMNEYVVLRQR